MNSDKARGYYSRFRGLRRDENAAIPAEINAGSPLNYTSANQLIIFFSPFRPFPPSQHRNPLPNQSPPSPPPPFSLFLNLLELNRANRVRPSLLVQFLGRYSLSAFIVTIATARPPELCCSIPNKDSSLIIIFDLAWGEGGESLYQSTVTDRRDTDTSTFLPVMIPLCLVIRRPPL